MLLPACLPNIAMQRRHSCANNSNDITTALTAANTHTNSAVPSNSFAFLSYFSQIYLPDPASLPFAFHFVWFCHSTDCQAERQGGSQARIQSGETVWRLTRPALMSTCSETTTTSIACYNIATNLAAVSGSHYCCCCRVECNCAVHSGIKRTPHISMNICAWLCVCVCIGAPVTFDGFVCVCAFAIFNICT